MSDEDECAAVPTRYCFGICQDAGYCFRFEWHHLEQASRDDGGPALAQASHASAYLDKTPG